MAGEGIQKEDGFVARKCASRLERCEPRGHSRRACLAVGSSLTLLSWLRSYNRETITA